MANDVKWIKITTDMFDNRKIRHLRRLPDGNNIVLIWVMLLTMAGRCNSNGMIFLTENIPYTPKMLADELCFEENTVLLALNALRQLNMIVTDGEFFSIAGWGEHQNTDGLERIREQNKLRKQRERERKLLMSRDSHVTVTQSHATEEDKEEERDKEKDTDIREIVEIYNSLCPSFPAVRSVSNARKKAIKARQNTYTLEDFRTLFTKAEASSFLKGNNDRNWTATFDWMIKDSNMAKILDGNYDDRPKKASGRREIVPEWMNRQDASTVNSEETKQMLQDMAAISPDLAARVEELKQRIQ